MKPLLKNVLLVGGAGLALYLAFLVALLPASMAWKMAPATLKQQVQLTGVQGSLWNGSALELVVNRNPLGKISWTLNPWSLIGGSAAGAFILEREPELLTGNYAVSGPGEFQLSDIELRLQGESLQPLTRPFVLHGSITARIDSISYQRRELISMTGTVNLRNTQVEGLQNIQLGNVEARVQPEGKGSLARFKNQDSPLDIQGEVRLNSSGRFDLSMNILNRDKNRKDLDNMLAIIGRPDSTGRVNLKYTRQIRLP